MTYKCDKCRKEFSSEEALNMHSKAVHPVINKDPLLTQKRKKKVKRYGILLVAILLIIALFYWLFVPLKNAPIIEIQPDSYDFGTVSQAKGVVSATMTIFNKGNRDLNLNNIDSSCGCTSASIISNGMEGPRFGMSSHGTNPRNWKEVIHPGENAQLKVYYDPNVHKDLQGLVVRSINVYSNDPRNRVKEVRISANQVA